MSQKQLNVSTRGLIMFNFGKKHYIIVKNYSDMNKTLYIRNIDAKAYNYTTTSNIKEAQLFRLEEANKIRNILRKRNSILSYIIF